MTALGIAALALLLTWIFGGFMLRVGGLLLVFAGATVLALSGNANGILVAAIGAVLWLLGHGHYALRRGIWRSRLAGWLWSGVGSALCCLYGPCAVLCQRKVSKARHFRKRDRDCPSAKPRKAFCPKPWKPPEMIRLRPRRTYVRGPQ